MNNFGLSQSQFNVHTQKEFDTVLLDKHDLFIYCYLSHKLFVWLSLSLKSIIMTPFSFVQNKKHLNLKSDSKIWIVLLFVKLNFLFPLYSTREQGMYSILYPDSIYLSMNFFDSLYNQNVETRCKAL